jgi:Transposase DDE domain
MRANSIYCRLRQLFHQASSPRRSCEHHSDGDIAFVLLWAEVHRRPVYWACRRSAYPPGARFKPPSSSTLSRRGSEQPVLELIEQTRLRLIDQLPPSPLKLIDSRPLTVGHASGDAQARRGRAAGAMARGYKLCLIAAGGVVRAWTIDSLNVNDQVLAERLIPTLGQSWSGGWGYVAADNGFDGNALYAQAALYNHLWLAPPRQSNRGVRDAKRNTPQRLRALDHSDSPLRHAGVRSTFGSQLMQLRGDIERLFGHSAQLGLGPLPHWIRTPQRVRRHVTCQLLLLTLRQLEIRHAKAAS